MTNHHEIPVLLMRPVVSHAQAARRLTTVQEEGWVNQGWDDFDPLQRQLEEATNAADEQPARQRKPETVYRRQAAARKNAV
ncbi:hypothetical protein ACUHMQ_11590 [Chitinimonas sp. PSY-7]|uniref:hypothetical protein n=1 Tax=Chitinimonas sp. PSY-7 TaxID=3459088 RepID=UPI0040401B6C